MTQKSKPKQKIPVSNFRMLKMLKFQGQALQLA